MNGGVKMTIHKYFNDLIKDKAKEMGFRKHGQREYYRVVNDMYQSFTLKITSQLACTYTFDVSPLCIGLTENIFKILGNGTFMADDFYVPKSKDDIDPTLYADIPTYTAGVTIKNERTMQRAASNIAPLMHEYVFPFFERASDSSVAFAEIEKMIDYQSDCIMERLRVRGYENPGSTKEAKMKLYGNVFAHLEMKNGRYDYPISYYRSELPRLVDDLEHFVYLSSIRLEERIAKCEERVRHCKKMIEVLENGDKAYIDKMLAENEAQSKAVLSAHGWKFK